MRFAIAAIDRYLGIFEALIRAGWESVELFTVPMRSLVDSNHGVIALAERYKIPIQLSPMTADDLQALGQKSCDVLIVASYNWKIPDWQPYLKCAVNFHCSPLPEGRGPYPAVRAILEKRDHWAVACHKVAADMDKGDVLAEESFPISDDECHESIDLKIQMAAKQLAFKTTKDFKKLWAQAKRQTGGSYWPRWKNEERIIDCSLPVERIMRQVRAFGLIEVLARVNNTMLNVRRAVGWVEPHNHKPGCVIHAYNRTIVMTAADGYIGILEWGLAAADMRCISPAASRASAFSGQARSGRLPYNSRKLSCSGQ